MRNSQDIVLATGNAGKLLEMQSLLKPLGFQVHPQTEFFSEEVVEDGLSFIENALIKARFASAKTGLPAIADDSGLQVLALQGAPGIYSARYSEGYLGLPASDEQNNKKLLAEMSAFPRNRKACYYCAMVYVAHSEDPVPKIGLGQWCGEVLTAPAGTEGFGYDPLIWFAEPKCTAAEMSKELKNKLSHRAQACQALVAQFERTT